MYMDDDEDGFDVTFDDGTDDDEGFDVTFDDEEWGTEDESLDVDGF